MLGSEWCDQQLSGFEAWVRTQSDPVLQVKVLDRPLHSNPVVAMLWAARRYQQSRSDYPSLPPAGAQRFLQVALDLATTESVAGRVFSERPEVHARRQMAKRLRNREGAWALIHETRTLAHFERLGLTPEPFFLIDSSPQEMVLTCEGERVPVECKVKLPGTGRVVSMEHFTRLACDLTRTLHALGRRVEVCIAGSTLSDDADVALLQGEVLRCSEQPGEGYALVSAAGGRHYAVQVKLLSDRQMTAADVAAKTVERSMFPALRVAGSDGREQVVIGMKCNGSHEPWRTWMDSLAEMAGKWAAHPPGIVAIHFSDPIDDLEAISPGAQADAAIRRWTEKCLASGAITRLQAERILSAPFPQGQAPSIDHVLLRMIDDLPQFAAVMFSTEPDLGLSQQGVPGSGWTLPTKRLPRAFPAGHARPSTRRLERLDA